MQTSSRNAPDELHLPEQTSWDTEHTGVSWELAHVIFRQIELTLEQYEFELLRSFACRFFPVVNPTGLHTPRLGESTHVEPQTPRQL